MPLFFRCDYCHEEWQVQDGEYVAPLECYVCGHGLCERCAIDNGIDVVCDDCAEAEEVVEDDDDV